MPDEALFDRLLKDRVAFLGAPIDDETANEVIARLLFLENEDPAREASLYINSPGGSVTAALALFDTLQYVRMPVSTVCVGQAAAAATLLLAAGAKGRRFALPMARISLHPLSRGKVGPSVDLAVQAQEIRRLTPVFQEALAACTGRSVDEVAAAMREDTYYSAQEAITFGLIDGVEMHRPIPSR